MEKRITPVEKLLKDIDTYTGDADIKQLLKKFITRDMMLAGGLIMIWTEGKHIQIEGTRFSDVEATWALEKAKYEVISGGLKFDD